MKCFLFGLIFLLPLTILSQPEKTQLTIKGDRVPKERVIWAKQAVLDAMINITAKGVQEASMQSRIRFQLYEGLSKELSKLSPKVKSLHVDSSFIYSLNVDLATIKEPLSFDQLNEVIDDLKAKNTIDYDTASISGNQPTTRKVMIKTVDTANKPQNNFTVYWQYWLDKENVNPRGNFNNPTSPSIDILSPGTYDIFVKNPKGDKRYPASPTKKAIFFDNGKNDNPQEITIIID